MSESWFSFCDGKTIVPGASEIDQLEYHSSLNVVLGVSNNRELKIFDANTGEVLQEKAAGVEDGRKILLQHHRNTGSVVVSDGNSFGYRCHNDGILLLQTALLTPIKSQVDVVTLELPISEAQMLVSLIHETDLSTLNQEGKDGNRTEENATKIDSIEEVVNQVMKEISTRDTSDKMSLSSKWATVKFSLQYETLKAACQTLLDCYNKQMMEKRTMISGYSEPRHSLYGVPIVSSLLHQLALLLPSDNPAQETSPLTPVSREQMYAELTRRQTFKNWPHPDYKYALPNAMAEAGFFHQPAAAGDDRAICFACNVCLVCWEPSDEPWSEHERHSPACPFVCCEPTTNAPISVTHANQPAMPNPFVDVEGIEDKRVAIDHIAVGENCGLIVGTSNDGFIATWDVTDKMPTVQNVCSIIRSSIVFRLTKFLRKYPNFTQAKYHVKEMSVTSLCVLDKLPSEPELIVTDPAEFLTNADGGTKDPEDISESQGNFMQNDNLSKVPTIVVGVVVEVTPWVYSATKLVKKMHDKEGSDPVKMESENGNGDLSHKFSLLLFLKPERSTALKRKSDPAHPLKNLTMSETTVYPPIYVDFQDEMPGHSMPYADPITQQIGHMVPDLTDSEILNALDAADIPIHDKPQGENSVMPWGKLKYESAFDPFMDDDFDNDGSINVDENANVQLSDEEKKNQNEKLKCVPASLLQLVLVDHCELTPESDGSKGTKKIQAINNILMSEDSSKLLITTSPEYFSVKSEPTQDTPILNQPMEEENCETEQQDDCTTDPKKTESASAVELSETTITDLSAVSEGTSMTLSNPPMTSDESHEEMEIAEDVQADIEEDSGRIFVFDIEPANSVRYVTPKEIKNEDEGVRWMKIPAVTQILNFPTDLFGATFDDDDEDAETADEEGDEQIIKENEEEQGADKSGNSSESSDVVVLCKDGNLRIVNINPLSTVFEIQPSSVLYGSDTAIAESSKSEDKFVAFTYCTNTERLCAVTNTGKLCFLKVGKHPKAGKLSQRSLSRSVGDELCSGQDQPGGSTSDETKKRKVNKEELLVNHPLTNENLRNLVQLTKFEPLKPQFSAKIPMNWVEVPFKELVNPGVHIPSRVSASLADEAQDKAPRKTKSNQPDVSVQLKLQRRHLRHPNEHYPHDAINHTRAWKLQRECAGSEMFEIILPRPTNMSHMDLKFVLSKKLKPGTDIQVTLLKHPGLATSKKEMMQNEKRKRRLARQVAKEQEKSGKRDHKKSNHMLTEGFVNNLMEVDIDNPVLLVVGEKDDGGPVKEYMMMDGSQETIVAICKKAPPELTVGHVVVIKGYMRVKVGSSDVRIIVGSLKICSDSEVKSMRVDELQSLEENWNSFDASSETKIANSPWEGPEAAVDYVYPPKYPGLDVPDAKIEQPPETVEFSDAEELDNLNLDRSNVLFGPVPLSDYVDASGIGGVITVASRWIIKNSRHRAVILLVENAQGNGHTDTGMRGRQPEEWRRQGCNNLQEISITINKSQRTNHIKHERIQRFGVLCSRTLHMKLLSSLCRTKPHPEKFAALSLPQKIMALDILNWVAALEASDPNERCKKDGPDRKNSSNTIVATRALSPTQSLAHLICFFEAKSKKSKSEKAAAASDSQTKTSEFDLEEKPTTSKITPVKDNEFSLRKFLQLCFLKSGREVAVRAMRLLFSTVLSVQVHGRGASAKISGKEVLCNAIIECLEAALEEKAESAYGMNCLFQILTVLMSADVRRGKGQNSKFLSLIQKCIGLLTKASDLMKDTIHPFNSILRSNHGLYGTPFDPERFTIEFVVSGNRNQSPGNTNPNKATEDAMKQQTWEKYFSNEELNIHDLVTPKNLDIRRALSTCDFDDSLCFSRFGLIECQPLHFSCVDTSEGCVVGVDPNNDIDSMMADTSTAPNINPSNGWMESGKFTPPGSVEMIKNFAKSIGEDIHSLSKKLDHSEGIHEILECYAKFKKSGVNEMPPLFVPGSTSTTYIQKMQQDIATTKRSVEELKDDPTDPIAQDVEETPEEGAESNTIVNLHIPNLSFSLPPSTYLTVSRMHSGARRSVVLDFGHIVEITDIHIPSCQDLSSLVLDAWPQGSKNSPSVEKSYFSHIGMALDICDHEFVLSNMSPPVITRYMRITAIGRYGTTNAQSAVNLGRFYGRPACVGFHRNSKDTRNDVPSPPKKTMKDSQNLETKESKDSRPVVFQIADLIDTAQGKTAIQRSLAYLRTYQDDIDCRYALSCYELKALLSSKHIDSSGVSWRMSDIATDQGPSFSTRKLTTEKLHSAYKKCSRLQVQRNRVSHSIRYMESILIGTEATPTFPFQSHPLFDPMEAKQPPTYTQLQTYCELMLNNLIALQPGLYRMPPSRQQLRDGLLNPELCRDFFKNLICNGNPRLRIQTTGVLLSYSAPYPWWGSFLAETLTFYFADTNPQKPSLSQEHLFATLLALGQRSLTVPKKAEDVLQSILDLLQKLLPIDTGDTPAAGSATAHDSAMAFAAIELSLVTWVMLYASHLVETITIQNESFMAGATPHISPPSASTKAEKDTPKKSQGTSTFSESDKSESFKAMPFPGHGSLSLAQPVWKMVSDTDGAKVINLGPSNAPSKVGSIKMKMGAPPLFPPTWSPLDNIGEGPSTSSPSTSMIPPSSKPPCNKKDMKTRGRWNFITISGDEGKEVNSCSGYAKILNWMQAINVRLQFRRSEIIKLAQEKKGILEKNKKATEASNESKIRLAEISAKAGEHYRNILSYRRSLDRKAVRSLLQKVKPLEKSSTKDSEAMPFPTSFIQVSLDLCRIVVKKILLLLLQLDFTVPADFIVLASKLAGQLCRWCSTQCIYLNQKLPEESTGGVRLPLFLSELLTQQEVQKLLLLISGASLVPNEIRDGIPQAPLSHSAGPWFKHALVSLLQDILESENVAMVKCGIGSSSMNDYAKLLKQDSEKSGGADPMDVATAEESVENRPEGGSGTESEIAVEDVESTSSDLESLNDAEFTKRIELANNFIKLSETFIADIKIHMKLQDSDETPVSLKDFNHEGKVLSMEPRPETAGIKGKAATGSEIEMQNGAIAAFLKNVRRADNAGSHISASGANRQLLCSHIYDNRSIHGIGRNIELTLKLCTMGHMSLLAEAIRHPLTFVVDERKEKMMTSEESTTPQIDATRSFKALRASILEILKKLNEYSVPLPRFCEIILVLQETFERVPDEHHDLIADPLTILGVDGAVLLMKKVMSESGYYYHDNLQIWSIVLNLLESVVSDKFRAADNAKLLYDLLRAGSAMPDFFYGMLCLELSASNVGPGHFNTGMSLLGPSICAQLKKLFDGYEKTAVVTETILIGTVGLSLPKLMIELRDFYMNIIYELSVHSMFDHTSQTATDGQIVVVEALLNILQNESVPIKTWDVNPRDLVTVVMEVARVSFHYLTWSENNVKSDSDRGVDPLSSMSGLLPSFITTPPASLLRQMDSPRDNLMLKLLKLSAALARILVPDNLTTSDISAPTSTTDVTPGTSDSVEAMDVDSDHRLQTEDRTKIMADSKKSSKMQTGTQGFIPLSDYVLRDKQIVQWLLASLSISNGSSIATLLNGLNISGLAVEKTPMSTSDGVLILLSALCDSATSPLLPVQAILRYFQGSKNGDGKYEPRGLPFSTCQLSKPLLWLILAVFRTPGEKVDAFVEAGGLRLIADYLVASARETISPSQGRTSQMLQYLAAASDRATAYAPRPPVVLHNEASWPSLRSGKATQKVTAAAQGFHYGMTPGVPVNTGNPPTVKLLASPMREKKEFDFASLATIECSDFSAQPADSLLKPKAIHRRARTPMWSYHFPENEYWVSLTLQFPTAFVLRSVKVVPMMLSLSTAPSAVVLEVNRSGSSKNPNFQPLSVPVVTSGIGDIVIVPASDEVVSSLRIYLKRPMDSSSIGLTRIAVCGVSDFMSYDNPSSSSGKSKFFTKTLAESTNMILDNNRKSTQNWLQLLHHFVTMEDAKLTPAINQIALEVDGLIPTLCALLERPSQNMFISTIEAVLLQSGMKKKVSELLCCVLKGSCFTGSSHFLGGFSRKSTESSVHLIYELCKADSDDLELRLQEIFKWVTENSASSPSAGISSLKKVDPSNVHAVACGLWRCSNTDSAKNSVSVELAKAVYTWCQNLKPSRPFEVPSVNHSSPLKNALDWLLCSMCNVNPDFYIAALEWMGLTNTQSSTVSLLNNEIETLSAISQTEESVKILGNLGIIQLFSNGLQRFCRSLLEACQIPNDTDFNESATALEVTPYNVVSVIDFFSGPCNIVLVQEWFGSEEGAKTWQVLLKTLYYVTFFTSKKAIPGYPGGILPRNLLFDLQESTINLLKKVTKCNEHNQELVTKSLCSIVSMQPSRPSRPTQLSGFVRFLLLRVVLEDESYTIHLTSGSGQKLHKGKSNSHVSGSVPLFHPMFGTGHFCRTFEIGVSSTIKNVWTAATDAPFSLEKKARIKVQGPQQKSKHIQHHQQHLISKLSSLASKPVMIPPPPPSVSYASVTKPSTSGKNGEQTYKDLFDVLATGKNAQEKRKSKLVDPADSQSKKSTGFALPKVLIKCTDLKTHNLDDNVSLLQLLAEYQNQNISLFCKQINLDFYILTDQSSTSGDSKDKTDKESDKMETDEQSSQATPSKKSGPKEEAEEKLKTFENAKPLKTILEVFANLGGLALVAEHLPAVTLDIGHATVSNASETRRLEVQQEIPDPFGNVIPMPEWAGPDDEDWFSGTPEEHGYYAYGFLDPEISSSGMTKVINKSTVKKQQTASVINTSSSNSCVPSHTMSALCSFLRVPFFAEEFLREQKAARCLLRLMLGVQDDGHGEQILKLSLAQSLPMLPFTAICSLLSRYDPTTTSGVKIREAMTFETTSIHLVLACLSRFTHNEPDEDTQAGRLLASLLPDHEAAPINVAPPSYKGATTGSSSTPKKANLGGKQHPEKNYWAKGTGFGTGSTTSDWDVGDAVKKQKKDEGYITVLLEVLANFVCPEAKSKDNANEDLSDFEKKCLPMDEKLSSVLPDLLTASGMIPAMASYLRNDSVLDMAHHVPLYCSLLSVIRSFSVCPLLCRLLMDSTVTMKRTLDGSSGASTDSILSLLTKMRKCIDTYSSRLKAINTSIDSQGEEGLTSLVENVQRTESMLSKIAKDIEQRDSNEMSQQTAGTSSDIGLQRNPLSTLSSQSIEKRYMERMKELQFDTAELVQESDEGNLKFPSGHYYGTHIKEAANVADASRARRLAQETVTLSNSLPLSLSSTVFVRCDEERLDVMKVMITGPSETPYANGCFEFDIFFPVDYNNSPPLVNLRTTGNHSVRFNPNLYNDGKVCLSILNTWHGRPEEKWNPQTSSFLQILVSIQSLILVSEPYFNEPGYERSRGTPAGEQCSREYDANIQQATVKWAMLEQLRNPSECFKDIIQVHFWLKRDEILAQCDEWLSEMKKHANEQRGRRTIAHNFTALQKHVNVLKSELTKMKCPEGLEDTQSTESNSTAKQENSSSEPSVSSSKAGNKL